MNAVPNITLNDGNPIPQLGFGVFQIKPEDTAEAVSKAFEIGYRHIDTAEMYGNEKEVGEAIHASGLARTEIFITSKLNNGFHEPPDARKAFDTTLSDLGLDYVDLFLIHWPLPTLYNGDFVSTWKTLEEFHRDGRSRSIGVSNFQIEHLKRLAAETDTVPAVNQIEAHPYFTNDAVRDYGREHGIATEAWSPIAKGGVLEDPTVVRIAGEVGKTPAQVVLRWHIQLGHIVFPKSVTPSRMEENFALFDFELDPEYMDAISALDRDEEGRTGPNPDLRPRSRLSLGWAEAEKAGRARSSPHPATETRRLPTRPAGTDFSPPSGLTGRSLSPGLNAALRHPYTAHAAA